MVKVREKKSSEKSEETLKPTGMNKFENDANDEKIYFMALGGLEHIGQNMYLYKYKGKYLVVDCGMGFLEEEIGAKLFDRIGKNLKRIKNFRIYVYFRGQRLKKTDNADGRRGKNQRLAACLCPFVADFNNPPFPVCRRKHDFDQSLSQKKIQKILRCRIEQCPEIAFVDKGAVFNPKHESSDDCRRN